jgi:hypothetical protein
MATEAAPMVERMARIFRFGDYPAKGWGITAEQFLAANGESGEVPVGFDPINLKHYEGKVSALDGMTGTASFTVEGDEVKAKVKLPAWLDEVRLKMGLKISSVVHRTNHKLHKIDLVDTPHIKDAVFFADQPEVEVFEDDEPEPVEFCDDGKLEMAQMHHEIAAACMPGLCSKSAMTKVHFSRETDAERGLRMLHDHSVHEGGAYCPGMDHHEGEIGMTDQEIEELQADNDRLREELEAATKGKTVQFADETPREKKLREDVERMQAQIDQKDAVSFADSVTRGKDAKAYPAERAAIIEGYKRAASDDARLGDTVTFTEGTASKEGSRLDAFKVAFAVRPRLTVRDEAVVGFELDHEPDAGKADEAEKAARERARQENQEWAKRYNAPTVAN